MMEINNNIIISVTYSKSLPKSVGPLKFSV